MADGGRVGEFLHQIIGDQRLPVRVVLNECLDMPLQEIGGDRHLRLLVHLRVAVRSEDRACRHVRPLPRDDTRPRCLPARRPDRSCRGSQSSSASTRGRPARRETCGPAPCVLGLREESALVPHHTRHLAPMIREYVNGDVLMRCVLQNTPFTSVEQVRGYTSGNCRLSDAKSLYP
jgi:hypothetical protein